jgi:hypothetical protein
MAPGILNSDVLYEEAVVMIFGKLVVLVPRAALANTMQPFVPPHGQRLMKTRNIERMFHK